MTAAMEHRGDQPLEAVEGLRLPADASAAPRARAFVAQQLSDKGLGALADDARLVVSELVGNAVLHARSAVGVRVLVVDGSRVRLEVADSSPVAPTFALMDTLARSGRGLVLVDAVSSRWGVDNDPSGGKTVWAELSTAAGGDVEELTAEDLLDRWAESARDDGPGDRWSAGFTDDASGERRAVPERLVVRLHDVPVAAMRAAKLQIEETVRDLQLVLLSDAHLHGDSGDTGPAGRSRTTGTSAAIAAADEEVRLARRLDAAAEEFGEVRRELRAQVMAAAAAGQQHATVTLHLPCMVMGAAQRYLQALEEADGLVHNGRLLHAGQLVEHADLRRWYLGQIIQQLSAAHRTLDGGLSTTAREQ